MGKYFPLLAVLAVGYWYWQGPYQEGRPSSLEQQLQENAKTMKRCMRREASMTAAAGMAGAATGSGDPEALCAQEHNLYLLEGEWHSRDAD